MVENFLNLEKKIDIQEAQIIPNKMSPKRTTPRDIIIKIVKFKDKERISKAERKNQFIMYKENSIRLSADFSAGTLQVRREWHDIFKMVKGKKTYNQEYSTWQSYSKLREKQSFLDKQKLKELITSKLALQEMLKRLL